jgi:hypothetical protein
VKNIKNSILILSGLIFTPLIGMEQLPQSQAKKPLPSFLHIIQQEEHKQNRAETGSQALAKKRQEGAASLQGLPSGLHGIILNLTTASHKYSDIKKLAQNIVSLAETDRALRASLNDPHTIITIFNALPYTANAITLAEFLNKKPGTLPVMKKPQITSWTKEAKNKLQFGRELMSAALLNKQDIVVALLNNRLLNLNVTTFGKTPLMDAISGGYAPIVRLLINAGADINAKDNSTTSTLMWAVISGRTDIVKLLIAEGVEVNAKANDGKTALIYASSHRNSEIVKDLIAAGADITAQTKFGQTARDTAITYDKAANVKILDDAARTLHNKKNKA